MKLLGKFKIGPYEWREYVVPFNSDTLRRHPDDCLNAAICDTGAFKIYLSDGLRGPSFEIARLHERLHAIWAYRIQGEIDEEIIVDALAEGLVQSGVVVPRKNKKS
jgi:hypothetical protein